MKHWFATQHHSEWLITDGDRLVATTAGSPAHLGPSAAAQDKANAHLLAAAPELLEALEAVLDNCLDSQGLFDAYAKARAAIAKATGEQQ